MSSTIYFSNFSKSLIVDFINKNHFDHKLARYVKPRKKFHVDFAQIDADLLLESSDTLKDLDSLISEIETSKMKVPVLLRQYMSLNAKIICFNIDPNFSDSLDGMSLKSLNIIKKGVVDAKNRNNF